MDRLEATRRTAGTFDRASSEFAASRRRPWPSVEMMGSVRGKRVLDLGAGAGRNARHFMEEGAEFVVAADISPGMLDMIGRQEGLFAVRCDAAHLPFVHSAFDAVAFVAALHHLPAGAREEAMSEVARVTSRGGAVLVTVWAPERPPMRSRPAPVEGASGRDILVPWGLSGDRYYHLFSSDELRALINGAGLAVSSLYVERISGTDLGVNLVAVAKK